MRWRRMDKKLPPIGSLVDLWRTGSEYEYYFGKRTTTQKHIEGVCWNDGEKGILVLDPKITKWRYSR